jgi:protein gp37
MSERSAIEWTDASWNPIRARNRETGKIGWHCEHVSTGCINCYAESMNKRLGTGLPFKPGYREDIEIFLDEKMLLAPLQWKRPRKIFTGSMTDLFADFVSDEQLDKIFAVMALCPQHTFQVLTKRAERMRQYVSAARARPVGMEAMEIAFVAHARDENSAVGARVTLTGDIPHLEIWPLPNVWLGVSCERQEEADERIPLLLQTPAAVRFISAEPLLGPIDLCSNNATRADKGIVDWLICGGESGSRARPMYPDWARDLRAQCGLLGIPFFFKQWGEFLPVGQCLPGFGKIHGATAVKPGRMKLHYAGTPKQAPKHAFADRGVAFTSTADGRLTFRVGKKAAGRLLDGREHNDMPERAA